MGWIILLLLALGAYFVYNYLVTLEREIRAEISQVETVVSPATGFQRVVVPAAQGLSLDQRIAAVIQTHPGLLQSALYAEFPDVEKKAVQKILLEFDRSGKISRTRSGNTYKLDLIG